MSETTAVDRPGRLGSELLTTAAVSLGHPLVRALLAMTFTTGLVDATSYVGLGHVFTVNQTGNIVLLAAGIAGSAGIRDVVHLPTERVDFEHGVALCARQDPHRIVEGAPRRPCGGGRV